MFPVICLGIYHQNGTIQKYIIFRGNQLSITDSDIFSNEELDIIHTQSIPIHYSLLSIHPDDSIYLIKQKIVYELRNLNIHFTLEEIYLFFKQNRIESPFSVFEAIQKVHFRTPSTEIKRDELNAVEMGQLFTNYGLTLTPELEQRILHSFEYPDDLETFSYDDWKNVWPWDNKVSRFHSLGQRFSTSYGEDPLLSAHPFFLHYEYLKHMTPMAMNTTERELIMNFIPEMVIDSAKIHVLKLFMASTESVLVHFQEKNNQNTGEINKEQELLALYFPHLFHTEKIHSYEDWKQYHSISTLPNADLLSPIDAIYELYETKISKEVIESKFIKKGITFFLFSLPSESNSIPLEYLFRQSTATKYMPYIQYNPGYKQEILYRLYSENMAQNGKKIPYLEKDLLKRWAKQIRNKNKAFLTLAIYPQLPQSKTKQTAFKNLPKWAGELFLRIYANGEMEIEGKPNTAWDEYSLEFLLVESITPILRQLNQWLQSSGYTLPKLVHWLPILENPENTENVIAENAKELDAKENSSIKVLDMTYEWNLETSDVLLKQLEQKREWLSSAFYYTSEWNDEKTIQKKGGPTLSFQRVENFQSMETENQWVAYYVQQNYSEPQIIEKLQTEHTLSKEGAIEIYTNFLQEFQTEQRNQQMNVPGRGWKKGQKQIRVKNTNPGFPTSFQFKSVDDCLIRVENICDFAYLNTLQIYIYFLYQLSKGLPITIQKRLEQKLVPKGPPPTILDVTPTFEKPRDEDLESESESDLEIEENSSVSDDDNEMGPEPEYIGTEFSEKTVHFLDKSRETQEPQEPEEIPGEEEESEDESVASELSELHYNEVEEEEEKEEENEKKGGKRNPPQKSQAKLEKEILSFLKSSMTKPKPAIKSGALPETQYKNQNVSKYWLDRMKKRDSGLFEIYASKEKEIPNFKAYSRTCQINDQRQPVLINEEEKQRIDREHPGSYTYALPYKSSEKAPNMYYICPKYWCFKTGTSMTEEEVQQGKCGPPGNAVPSNFTASDATKNQDTSLVHFNDKKQHRDVKGNYIQNNPGFIKRDGICMPCCFKRARPEVSCEESRQVGEYTTNDYIITDETKRLEPMKWGFLPIAIQNYFHYFPNLKENMDGKRLKLHKPMLLRYGVEQYPNQSFLGVIADWYTAIHNLEETITVGELREVLSTAISLDQFLQYNNGSLVAAFRATETNITAFPSKTPALITSSFSSPEKTVKPVAKSTAPTTQVFYPNNVDYTQSKYTSSLFIQRIQPTTDAKRAIISDAIASYENFLQFLKNPASEIDPTYLWDAISQPNPKLFPKGYNLVLLSLPENDITQNVDLICPSMVYSSQIYDTRKESGIILLHNGFYEPIYVLERTDKDKERITKFYLSKNSSVLNGTINQTMNRIQETIQTQCSPKPSVKSYTFERPIYLTDLVANLKKLTATYRMIGHVWNYSGKIIGLQVAPYPQTEDPNKKSVMIPCFPTIHSPLSSKHEANQSHRFIDEKGIWVDFQTTLQILRKLNKESTMTATGSGIPCMPIIEVVEDDMIVGILTQTNQFVAIQPPIAYKSTAPPPLEPPKKGKKAVKPLEKDLATGLMVLRSTNYIQADIALSSSPQADPERERWVRDIRLENKFYSIFRSMVRLELNLYENRGIRKQIMTMIQRFNQGRAKYRETLNQFVENIQTLLKESVSFITFDEGVLEELYRISNEREFTPCMDSENPEPYCMYSSEPVITERENLGQPGGGKGKLLLPKKNRVNENGDNERGYYLRLADEMIRYPRIQNYLIFPTSQLIIQNSEYRIQPTEIILSQSVLIPENATSEDYFKNLKLPSHNSQYVPYEFSEPMKTEMYSNLAQANVEKQTIANVREKEKETEPQNQSPFSPDQSPSSSLERRELAEQERMLQEFHVFYDTCVSQTVPVIGFLGNSAWKRMFPKNTKEIIYQGTTQTQSFCCIMNVIYSYLKRPLTLHETKKQLVEAYQPWMTSSPNYKKKITKSLSKYNSALVKQWKRTENWETIFYNETYIFSELDFWVMANALQLPIILFTSNSLKNIFPYQAGVPPIQWLLLYPHRLTEKHYFIRPPTDIKAEQLAPNYHKIEPAMILNTLKDEGYNQLTLEQQIQDGLENPASFYAKNVMSLETYLSLP